MAQRDSSNIKKALKSKGFIEENNDHYFYTFVHDNKKTAIFTKISKGSSYKTIGQDLLSKMAIQLKLSNQEFLELVDCTIGNKAYLKILFDKKIIKSNHSFSK